MTVAVWLFTAGNMRGWVYLRAMPTASVVLIQVRLAALRLAACGVRYPSVLYFCGVKRKGEVALALPLTPNAGSGRSDGVGGSQVHRRPQTGPGWGRSALHDPSHAFVSTRGNPPGIT
jgi:hypothetical protein